MLEVQKYLLAVKSIDNLVEEFKFNTVYHPELPIVIINYDQLESPKLHKITRECRALCLNKNTFELVYRSFPRFFNLGECIEDDKKFNWNKFTTLSKEDGSLFIIYNFEGKWYGNTRGSFGLDKIGYESFSWRDAALKAMGISSWNELDKWLDPSITYVCELTTPWNKIVRVYDKPRLYLLTTFLGEIELKELPQFKHQLFERPQLYDFSSITEIKDFLDSIKDPTFEGVVNRDDQDTRNKCKRKEYLALHALRGEGDNLFNPKHLIPFVLNGEKDELLTYYPEVKEKFIEVEAKINHQFNLLSDLYDQVKDIENQKEFALAIQNKHKFGNLLFQARKTKQDLKNIWKNSSDMILKYLFKD